MENADFVCMTPWVLASKSRSVDHSKKKTPHALVISLWFAPWGLSTVVCCYCWVRPLQIFLTALSLWDRRLLRLAHWPCSMSGPKGAKWAWESQLTQGTSAKHNTKHVQTLDYTRLVFVEPAIQVWMRIRTFKGVLFAISGNNLVCCSSGCDFIWLLCACLYGFERVSKMEAFSGVGLLVSTLIHHRASILKRGP